MVHLSGLLRAASLLPVVPLFSMLFLASNPAEAGQFTCSKPASYYYNCGNKEFPQANFCPSDYRRECGDYAQRQRQVEEVKRAVARPSKREEPSDSIPDFESPEKAPAAKAPKAKPAKVAKAEPADADAVEPVEPAEEKPPVAKAPPRKEEPVAVKAPEETPPAKREEVKRDEIRATTPKAEATELEDTVAPVKQAEVTAPPAKPVPPAKAAAPAPIKPAEPAKPAADQPLVLKGKESVCSADADALRGKASKSKGVVNDVATKLTAQQIHLLNGSIRKQFGLNLTPETNSLTKPPNPRARSCDGQGDLMTLASGRFYAAGCMNQATQDKKSVNLQVADGKIYYISDRGLKFGITACVFAGGKVTLNAYSDEPNAKYVGNKITLTSQMKGETAEIQVHDGFRELIGRSSVSVPKESVAGEGGRAVAGAP